MSNSKTLTEDIVETGKMMLWEFGNQLSGPGKRKEKVSLVFLSRTLRQLQAIEHLVAARFISDGWICFRSLVERYLLFVHLCEKNDFQVFDDWCFREQYKNLDIINSLPEFRDKQELRQRRFSVEDKKRYEVVSSKPGVRKWKRPDMKAIAKSLNMKFLYDAAYRYASAYVHPLSVDGMLDYLHLMSRAPEPTKEDVRALIENARLITILQMQHLMNQREYNWRRVLYDLLDAFTKTLEREDTDYTEILQKVRFFHKSGNGLLCDARDEV